METNNVIIIGLGSAGYAALSTIKRISSKTKITIIDQKETDLFHPCGLPYALEGLFPLDNLKQNIFLEKMGVERIKATVTQIDQKSKEVVAQNESGEIRVPYSSVLIATGTYPMTPPIKGLESCMGKRLFNLVNASDCQMINDKLPGSKSGAVIGAGAIGLESALALAKNLDKTYVIEMKEQILPNVLDNDMATIVKEYLDREHNIEIINGTAVQGLEENNDKIVITLDNDTLEVDLCILATGFKPDLKIAQNSDIETSNFGIVTSETMETTASNVYAAGDCATAKSILDGKLSNVSLATSAYKMGIVAGKNICGEKVTYHGTAGTFVTHIGKMEVAGTGFNTEEAKARGFNPVVGKIKMGILPDYFPGNTEIAIKILADKESGKILGAQAAGFKGAAERVNIISTAIEFNLPLPEVLRIEMAYCPAVSEVHDPLFKAIEFLQRRIKK
jgi:NADH oxidase (H2O2-forming)